MVRLSLSSTLLVASLSLVSAGRSNSLRSTNQEQERRSAHSLQSQHYAREIVVPIVTDHAHLARRDSDPFKEAQSAILQTRMKLQTGFKAFQANMGRKSLLEGIFNQVVTPMMTWKPNDNAATTSTNGIKDASELAEETFTKDISAVAAALEGTADSSSGPTKRAVTLHSGGQGSYYAGQIKVGVPRYDVLIQFDSGSADFVINKGTYEVKKSSSAKKTTKKFNVSYADGTGASGPVYEETLDLGRGQVLHGQPVGVASKSTLGDAAPGIAGLGWRSISTSHSSSFFHRLLTNKVIKRGIAAFAMYGSQPEVRFGSTDKSKYKGKLQFVDVDSEQGYWTINGGSLHGTNNGKQADAKGTTFIMDTGSSLIATSRKTMQAYFDALGIPTGEESGILYGMYTDDAPAMSFKLGSGSTTATVPLLDSSIQWSTLKNGTKVMSVVGNDDLGIPEGTWLVGLPIFTSAYSVFEIAHGETPKIGFAQPVV